MSNAILYSCKSWYTLNLHAVEQPYLQALKSMLGVRQQTCSDLIYIELGTASAKAVILERQIAFLKTKKAEEGFAGSILGKTLSLAKQVQSPMGRHLLAIERLENPSGRKETVRLSDTTRRLTYLQMNPFLEKSKVYECPVTEYARISFSRLRLASHRLKIETGRWSRIPKEQRLCECGSIQTEEHVLTQCPNTQVVRDKFPMLIYNDIVSLMQTAHIQELVIFIHRVLKLTEKR